MRGSELFPASGVWQATSDKRDGHTSFGHINEQQTNDNINRFLARLDWPIKGYAFMRIGHEPGNIYDAVEIVDRLDKTRPKINRQSAPIVDAVVTNLPNVALILPTADCYAVTIHDPINRVLALAHMGWQSTDARLLIKLVDQMRARFDSNPTNLLAHFGPGIPAKYYVFKAVSQVRDPDWKDYLLKDKAGYHIDLKGFNINQLTNLGVNRQNIDLDPRNTVEAPELESNFIHNQAKLSTARRFLNIVMMSR
ncbi:MAG TPA: polyphenol oxidase family protein [Candidatus Saccharimonadales bacterium]